MGVSFDEVDRRIIDQLRLDGRMPFTEIARKVNISEASVRSRYQRMRDQGVVDVVAMTDPIQLGALETHLALHVRGVRLDEVATALLELPEVRFIASGLGSYDLIVNLQTSSIKGMTDTVIDRIRRLRGIETVDTLTVHEIVKDSFIWEGFGDTDGDRSRR